MYHDDKLESRRDIFGAADVTVERACIRVGARRYPVVEDVIVLLEPSRTPPTVSARIAAQDPSAGGGGQERPASGAFASDIQFTFGEEWQRYPDVLPEHAAEFALYFDIVDIPALANERVCDIGCGIGRWSHHPAGRRRELVLVDFSEAIFVARRNLAHDAKALFFMGDLRQRPFRDGFASSLGVLRG